MLNKGNKTCFHNLRRMPEKDSFLWACQMRGPHSKRPKQTSTFDWKYEIDACMLFRTGKFLVGLQPLTVARVSCDSFLRKQSRGGYSEDIEEHRESQYWSFAEENGRGYVPGPLDVDLKECILVPRRGQWLGMKGCPTEG